MPLILSEKEGPMSVRKMTFFVAICMLCIGMMVGCSKTAEETTVEETTVEEATPKETYKVGAVFSVTGRASFLGDPEKKTAEMVADAINKAGGINGHKLELIVYDDEGDATKANLAVKKLITQDKVLAVIGPSTSGNSMAVVPLAEEHKIPLISCAASYKIVTDEETGKQREWVFKVPQSDSMAVEAIYTHLNKRGLKKVAIMSVTTGFGASGRGELIRLAPKFGIAIVADEKYGPQDNDMTAQLTKIKGMDVEAIINWTIGPTQVVILRNWKDLGMTNITFYQSHGFGSRKNIELAAGAAEGVFAPLGACNTPEVLPADHPQKEVTMTYNKNYMAAYNEPVSSFGGHAWDALNLVVDALKAVGGDKAAIRDYLEQKKDFAGQHGVFSFSKDDHNGLAWQDAFNMIVVKDGDWAVAD